MRIIQQVNVSKNIYKLCKSLLHNKLKIYYLKQHKLKSNIPPCIFYIFHNLYNLLKNRKNCGGE